MRNRRNPEPNTAGKRKKSGEPGRSAGPSRATGESGPLIYPGMEDAGIGSVIYTDGEPYDEDDAFSDEDDAFFDGDGVFSEGDDDEFGGDEPGAAGPDDGDDEDTDDDEDAEDEGEGLFARKRRRRNGPFLFISAAFILLFLLLMGHLVCFNLFEKDRILNSPYNKRQNSQADRVIRGPIVSIDGSTLAKTNVYEGGTEERVYPYANIFAHTVGFSTHGKSGLESIANYQLLTAHNNIIDQIINEFRKKKNPGDTVVTTLNASLQETCYYALGDYRGAVVVLDAKTGAVRAMVSKPDFDPNTLASVWDEMVSDSSNSQLLNRATQGLYPPGSTFKIVTALSYFRAYNTFSGFEYDCTGEFEVGDSVVHCYQGASHGLEDFAGAFAHSCNTAFSEIGLKLGASRLTSTAKDMMFGESLPCELNASRPRWQLEVPADDVDLVQTAFGQGKTLTTPYHMALICSAIANKGVVMSPYLIDHVENNQGHVISRNSPSRYRRIMTEEEAAELTALMKQVVSGGTASALSGRVYEAAGKTGSAEYYKSDGSIGTHSWFVGFTNPDDPDLIIAVLAENGGAGSSTAVPIAEEILDSYYY